MGGASHSWRRFCNFVRPMKTSHWTRLGMRIGKGLGLATFSAMIVVAGCGNPAEEEASVNVMQVDGSAFYGTQCPSGSVRDPSPMDLFLRDCPIKVQSI